MGCSSPHIAETLSMNRTRLTSKSEQPPNMIIVKQSPGSFRMQRTVVDEIFVFFQSAHFSLLVFVVTPPMLRRFSLAVRHHRFDRVQLRLSPSL